MNNLNRKSYKYNPKDKRKQIIFKIINLEVIL